MTDWSDAVERNPCHLVSWLDKMSSSKRSSHSAHTNSDWKCQSLVPALKVMCYSHSGLGLFVQFYRRFSKSVVLELLKFGAQPMSNSFLPGHIAFLATLITCCFDHWNIFISCIRCLKNFNLGVVLFQTLIDGSQCDQAFNFKSWDEVDVVSEKIETIGCSNWKTFNSAGCEKEIPIKSGWCSH